MAALCPMAFILPLGAQTLSLSSAAASSAGTASLNLILTSGANSVAALEWTIQYPAGGLNSISATAGPVLTAAGKSVTCNPTQGSYVCVAYGLNATTIPDGVVATIAVAASQT